ncbi:hypothetical protein C3B47_00750 [Flavobacterium columnare]|nr:hypothetical protein AQ623_12985 [Flavobacterium columnare]MBF6651443.1 hypothetical protein [Flavobacterium columnare]PTD14733.1 hypothetical protein C6N29_09960 [Flavobacterium columnare]QOG91905.1 hypothetical protein HUE42_04020 [Flavobacterium columnare]
MLIFLKGCQKYQLTFNNLNFSMSTDELDAFYLYLKRMNPAYWEKEYEHSVYEKKIPIPTLQDNFIIMINRIELFELQVLTKPNKTEIFKLVENQILSINWN